MTFSNDTLVQQWAVAIKSDIDINVATLDMVLKYKLVNEGISEDEAERTFSNILNHTVQSDPRFAPCLDRLKAPIKSLNMDEIKSINNQILSLIS